MWHNARTISPRILRCPQQSFRPCKGGRFRDGEEREYLVPTDEYRARGRHGFVIDPSRHPRVPED